MTNTIRDHRISELSARIHELERTLHAHRTAAPSSGASEGERRAWLIRDHELQTELHQCRLDRLDLTERRGR